MSQLISLVHCIHAKQTILKFFFSLEKATILCSQTFRPLDTELKKINYYNRVESILYSISSMAFLDSDFRFNPNKDISSNVLEYPRHR